MNVTDTCVGLILKKALSPFGLACMRRSLSGKHVRVMYTPYYPTYTVYVVKLGYTGVYLFFVCLIQNIDCGYSLEPF